MSQDDTELLEPSYTKGNMTVLVLDGDPKNNGIYSCRWNNTFGEDFKHFTVNYVDRPEGVDTNIIIAVGTTVSILIIAGVAIGIKLYLAKVINAFIQRKHQNNN